MIVRNENNKTFLERAAYTAVEGHVALDEAIDEFRRLYVAEAMRKYDNNQSRAARKLGVHRNTFHRWTNETGQKEPCQSVNLPNLSSQSYKS